MSGTILVSFSQEQLMAPYKRLTNCGHLLKECVLFLQLARIDAKYILSIRANFSRQNTAVQCLRCICFHTQNPGLFASRIVRQG